MRGYITCRCCNEPIAVVQADIGQTVECPRTGKLILVDPDQFEIALESTPRPQPKRSRLPYALVALALLLIAGGGYLAFDNLRQTDRTGPEIVRATPTTSTNTDGATPTPVTSTTGVTIGPTTPPPSTRPAVIEKPPVVIPAPVPSPMPEPTPAPMPMPIPMTGTNPTPEPSLPPMPPEPIPEPADDEHGLKVHRLAKRIDLRSEEELLQELLRVRIVSLDAAPSTRIADALVGVGQATRQVNGFYPGSIIAARGRPDLAGLPFRHGHEVILSREKAQALDSASHRLRATVQTCIAANGGDTRPDPDKLFEVLLSGDDGLSQDSKWATPSAIPCVRQMLQPEDRAVRRMSVELLRQIGTSAAVTPLADWAVFDTDAANRAAAVNALQDAERTEVIELLLEQLRYPWPRAAEHAAEALVALDAKSAVPALAAMLSLPDPDTAVAVKLPGEKRAFQREMVRVNHARNCLLCHPPSFAADDLVRGAVPDPTRALPTPSTPAYYNNGGSFVSADRTYLRQDFSVPQPVTDRGQWPQYQRFDYLVATVPTESTPSPKADGPSPYHEAVLFALRELTGKDLGDDEYAWAALRGNRPPPDDRADARAAMFVSLSTNPEPLSRFVAEDFGPTLVDLSAAEQTVVLTRFRRIYGANATWAALIAYLERLAGSDDESARDRANELLTIYRTRGPSAFDKPDAAVAADLLKSKDARIRAEAANALGELGDEASFRYKELIEALRDLDPDVRFAAATAIGQLGDGPDEMYVALARAAADTVGRVRVAVSKSLTNLETLPEKAVRPLSESFVKAGRWDTPAEQAAAQTPIVDMLAKLGPKAVSGRSAIIQAAAGRTRTDVPAADLAKLLRVMGQPGQSDLSLLVPLLAVREYRTIAEDYLMAAGGNAIDPLIGGMSSADPKVRTAVAGTLGRAASLRRTKGVRLDHWRKAIDALAAAKANDDDPTVQSAAASALTLLSKSR